MIREKAPVIEWLLSGDPAIVYQVHRDLLNTDVSQLAEFRKVITREGWGKKFLEQRDNTTGKWGNGIYSPKWISTTYTLLEIKSLSIEPQTKEFLSSSQLILDNLWSLPQKKKDSYQDMCVCGMILSLCCYSGIKSCSINEIVDYILAKQYPDGGWNCRWELDFNHSSLHTTINILEGLHEYITNKYEYRAIELKNALKKAHEFILMHKLFKSDKTGKVIDQNMTMLSYPSRWKYDILRCLDYFQTSEQEYDPRMEDALEVIMKKKMKNDHWPIQKKHPGLVHIDMEKTGKESRWNTLRVLRVLKRYKSEKYSQFTCL